MNIKKKSIEQFLDFKIEYPDFIVAFHIGSFYEFFMEDAIIVSEKVGLTLTFKGYHDGKKVQMCGFPKKSSVLYFSMLLAKGYRMVICDEAPISPQDFYNKQKEKGKKSLHNRKITKILTPGTVQESIFLNEKTNNYLVVIEPDAKAKDLFLNEKKDNKTLKGHFSLLDKAENPKIPVWCCMAIDISTGFITANFFQESYQIFSWLERIMPREILVPDFLWKCRHQGLWSKWAHKMFFCDIHNCKNRTYDQYASLEKDVINNILIHYHKNHHELLSHSFCYIFSYIIFCGYNIQNIFPSIADTPVTIDQHIACEKEHQHMLGCDFLDIDDTAWKQLEIMTGLNGDYEKGLKYTMDHTATALGARLWARWIAFPICNKKIIDERLSAIHCALQNPDHLKRIRMIFEKIPDIERLLQNFLNPSKTHTTDQWSELGNGFSAVSELCNNIEIFLSEMKNTKIWQNAMFFCHKNKKRINDWTQGILLFCEKKNNINPEDDPENNNIYTTHDTIDYRISISKKKELIKMLQEKFRLTTLDIVLHSSGEYLLFINDEEKIYIPYEFQKKYTQYYFCEELKDWSTQHKMIEQNIFNHDLSMTQSIIQTLKESQPILIDFFYYISVLDIVTGFAMAEHGGSKFCIPQLLTESSEENVFELEDGIHPVMSQQCLYIPNNCFLYNEQIMFLTGANAGGKTTYLRMLGQLTLLAHIGVLVPAKKFVLSIKNAIFVRIGSGDKPSENLSTFAVELMDLQHILTYARHHSLILVDEIGRGTSPTEGWALCRAVLLEIMLKIKGITIFATHFHDLIYNFPQHLMKRLFLCYMNGYIDPETCNWRSFYKIKQGNAMISHGLDLARQLNISEELINNTKNIIEEGIYAEITNKPKKLLTFLQNSMMSFDKNSKFDFDEKQKIFSINKIQSQQKEILQEETNINNDIDNILSEQDQLEYNKIVQEYTAPTIETQYEEISFVDISYNYNIFNKKNILQEEFFDFKKQA